MIRPDVEITAVSKSGNGETLRYAFNIEMNFLFLSTIVDGNSIGVQCSQNGGVLPTVSQLTTGSSARGTVGVLFSEWGDVRSLSAVVGNMDQFYFWTSDTIEAGGYIYKRSVNLIDGTINDERLDANLHLVCAINP